MDSTKHASGWDDHGLRDPHAQPDKAQRVRAMFDAIAPTYELVNRVASLGQDARWRRKLVRLAEVRPDDRMLDVASGTGDVARVFEKAHPSPRMIVASDFALGMLRLARPRGGETQEFCQADACRLPFASDSFSIVTCAFGIRNFQSLETGLAEIHRVLEPGGRALILEFGVPAFPVIRQLYLFYFQKLMPMAATRVSRDRTGAYRYLPRSVVSFANPEEIRASLVGAGFSRVEVVPLTLGVVSIYRAIK